MSAYGVHLFRFGAVSALLSLAGALLASVLSATYVVPVTLPGEPSVLTHLPAVRRQISETGLGAYVLNLLPFLVASALSCWTAFYVESRYVRVPSFVRRVLMSLCAAVAFSILYCIVGQTTVVPNQEGGAPRVVEGLSGALIAIQVFGIGSLFLRILGYALLFFASTLLSSTFCAKNIRSDRVLVSATRGE